MAAIKRLVLDVLKPHTPSALDFCCRLAESCPGHRVNYRLIEGDENTESVEIRVTGEDIPMGSLAATIQALGAALHSIDEVEAVCVAVDNS